MTTSQALLLVCLAAAAAAVAAIGGCGGGGDSTEASLTKKQYIAKAEKICGQGEKEQIDLAFAYTEKHPGAEEEELLEPAALPPIEKEIEKLAELEAPQGDEAKVQAMIVALEEGLEKGKAEPLDLLAQQHPFVRSDKLAKEYGLNICANLP